MTMTACLKVFFMLQLSVYHFSYIKLYQLCSLFKHFK